MTADEIDSDETVKAKFFTKSRLIFWGISLLVIASLLLISQPIVIRSIARNRATDVHKKAKMLYASFKNYSRDHGGYLPSSEENSDLVFQKLINQSYLKEATLLTRSAGYNYDSPSNMRDGKIEENIYTYWVKNDRQPYHLSNDSEHHPIISSPLIKSEQPQPFHQGIYDGQVLGWQAVALHLDGSAYIYRLSDSGKINTLVIYDENQKRYTHLTGFNHTNSYPIYPAKCEDINELDEANSK